MQRNARDVEVVLSPQPPERAFVGEAEQVGRPEGVAALLKVEALRRACIALGNRKTENHMGWGGCTCAERTLRTKCRELVRLSAERQAQAVGKPLYCVLKQQLNSNSAGSRPHYRHVTPWSLETATPTSVPKHQDRLGRVRSEARRCV